MGIRRGRKDDTWCVLDDLCFRAQFLPRYRYFVTYQGHYFLTARNTAPQLPEILLAYDWLPSSHPPLAVQNPFLPSLTPVQTPRRDFSGVSEAPGFLGSRERYTHATPTVSTSSRSSPDNCSMTMWSETAVALPLPFVTASTILRGHIASFG